MKQPVYAAKLTALKADLDKMVEAQQISPEQYEMALAGAQQQIVQEAMMAMGVAGASLDPRTHQRTGVLGY
jgi:flagellar hook-basal body complex protein FliE